MKKKTKKINVVKILTIIILVWCVSASYSYYISSESVSYANRGFNVQDFNIIDVLSERIFPGHLRLKVKSAVIVDAETGEVIFSKNEDKQLPIASLTKLATVMVFLNTVPDLNTTITITESDLSNAGRSRLHRGVTVTLNDCLHLCLMRSDNVASRALARSTGVSIAEFVSMMNNLASELGMRNTHFVEPTGRNENNISTAEDLTGLVKSAFNNVIIARVTSKKYYKFQPLNNDISYTLYNSNNLLYSGWNINGGKTGYINQAGYCLALNVTYNTGRNMNAILLGAPSNNYRYRDANRLLSYAMKD